MSTDRSWRRCSRRSSAPAGMDGINPTGKFHERALWRGSLRGWFASGEAEVRGSLIHEGPEADIGFGA